MKMEKQYKTYQIWIKNGHRMHAYFKTSCELAKNMYNTTNFYYRQVYTALTQIKELQPLQKEVLSTIQDNISKMNDVQLLAYQKKRDIEKLKPAETRRDVKRNLFKTPTKENPYVGYNFLDALFKVIVQNDYRSLPVQSKG
jgi:putative transposase